MHRRARIQRPGGAVAGPVLRGGAADEASLADRPWWDLFSDPALRSLVDEALKNGQDVRIAAARVEEARARYGVAGSVVPRGGLRGGRRADRRRLRDAERRDGDLIVVNATVSWELDLWGRIRRLNESARAEVLASEEARRGVDLWLVSDVASAYFDLRELDEELEIARHTRAAFQDTYDLFSRRLEGGAGSALETSRAEALLANASAQIPLVGRRIVGGEPDRAAARPGSRPHRPRRRAGRPASPPAVPPGFPPRCC